MTDKKKKQPEGEVSKRRFGAILGVATTLLAISLISMLSIGMVMGGALGVGIGGFVAEFEQVSYSAGDAEIYPVLGSQPACDNAPQIEASLNGTSTLTGNVSFFKDLPLPDGVGFTSNKIARISIVASSPNGITVKDLDLRLTALETPNLSLKGANIQEFGPSNYSGSQDANESYVPSGTTNALDPTTGTATTPEFGISATSFNLPSGGVAAAHQVSFSSISLQNLNLYVAIDNKSDFVSPIQRVVDPTQRTCAALATASDQNTVNSSISNEPGFNPGS